MSSACNTWTVNAPNAHCTVRNTAFIPSFGLLLVSQTRQHHWRYQSADRRHTWEQYTVQGMHKRINPGYLLVARFKRDAAARRVYTQVQETIRPADYDLSCYNLRLNSEPTVVVVGDAPPADLDERLRRMLAAGAPADLPPNNISACRSAVRPAAR